MDKEIVLTQEEREALLQGLGYWTKQPTSSGAPHAPPNSYEIAVLGNLHARLMQGE